MACEGAKGTVETAYLSALQATTAYEITDAGELKLTAGATTLKFTKATRRPHRCSESGLDSGHWSHDGGTDGSAAS
jgi:hypothetical protein